jgi:hypothetical protein
VKDGVVTQTLIPKTSDAAEKEPISRIAQLQFDERHGGIREKFREALEFGSFEPGRSMRRS